MHASRMAASPAAISLLLAAGALAPSTAATLRVPFEYATIQEAIDTAEQADTILIADGTYSLAGNRDLTFGGKDLIVRSENGPATTVIDCGGTAAEPHRGFHLRTSETSASVIEGLTIRHGFAYMPGGAGILCDGASPVLRRCVFRDNTVEGFGEDGGGVLLRGSSALIEECAFLSNYASYGGGLSCRSTSDARILGCRFENNSAAHGAGIDAGGTSGVTILDCTFAGNEATGGLGNPGFGGALLLGGNVAVESCTITGNSAGRGAGVAIMAGQARIAGCTLAGNRATDSGGGFMAVGSAVSFVRSVLWNNCAPVGSTGVAGSGSTSSFGCSIFDADAISHDGGVIVDLGDNLGRDPLFCAPAVCESAPTVEGDYRITSSSPCIPALSPCGDWIGSQPIGCPASDAPEPLTHSARAVALGPVYPNPVRSSMHAVLHLSLAMSCFVEVVDVQGRRVTTVLDATLDPGDHQLEWSISNRTPSGFYFLILRAGGLIEKRSFVLLPPG